MEKLASSFVSNITKLTKRFETLLENDFDTKAQDIENIQNNFESSRDIQLIRGLSQGLPEDHVDRAIVIFSRLAMHFEGGILLENQDGKWCSQAQFSRGHIQLIKTQERKFLSLPNVAIASVLKTSSGALLQKLNLTVLDPQKKCTCLVFKVTPDFSFVLLSELADIWLKEHTENIRQALINGFAE